MDAVAKVTPIQKLDLLNKEVEKHTPWLLTKLLIFAIPLFWLIGGIYLYSQSQKRSKALEKLERVYYKCKNAPLSAEDKNIQLTAKKILKRYGLPQVSKYETHLRKPHIYFQTEAMRKIDSLFKDDKNTLDFDDKIFPIYLALARAPQAKTDLLILSLPETIKAAFPEGYTIDRTKIDALRKALVELESQIEKQPKVLAHFSSDQNSKNGVDACIKRGMHYSVKIYNDVLNPNRYLFEEDVKQGIAAVFGELWTPPFQETLFPIYLFFATSQNDSETAFTQEELELFLTLISDQNKALIPNNHLIQPEKIQSLQEVLQTLKKRLAANPDLKALYNTDSRPIGLQIALDSCIQSVLPYNNKFYHFGNSIYDNAFYTRAYWTNPKYSHIPNKQLVFQIASSLKNGEGFDETLDLVIKYLRIDREGFTNDFNTWRAGLLNANPVTNEQFLKQCKDRYDQRNFKKNHPPLLHLLGTPEFYRPSSPKLPIRWLDPL